MIKSRVGGEDEAWGDIFLYFLASLRARKYEIKLSTKVEDNPKGEIYLIIMWACTFSSITLF